MILRFLIEKEFRQIARNPLLPRLIVIFPCVMILVMPWAANSEIKNINLAVADNDRSTLSVRLCDKMVSSGYFRLVDAPASYPEAMKSIESGAADLILEIPPRFEKDLMTGLRPQVLIAANSVNGSKAGLATGYAAAITADFSAELREQYAGLSPERQGGGAFTVATLNLYNPQGDYKLFMVPALMVMLLTMLCGFLPALNIVNEKESGTIEQINVTPVRKSTFILGKLIPYWIIGFVVITLSVLAAWAVYGFLPAGSMATIYLFTLLFVVMITGLGLIISNHSATMQQAMFVMFFFVIVFILMSGLFTPVESMPRWAQAITVANPLKYFIQAMRDVYLKGSAAADLTAQALALAAFGAFFNAWAVISYRKSS